MTERTELPNTVFISHITEESPIAIVLQRYIQESFENKLNVFVSSDRKSITGGEEWWQHIRSSLKQARIVLLLLSDESVGRPWINYEAGVGDGAIARIIPISTRSFNFGKLGFPLRGFNGRPIGDLEGSSMIFHSRRVLFPNLVTLLNLSKRSKRRKQP